MAFLIGLMTLGILGMVLAGIYLEFQPVRSDRAKRWFRNTLAGNIVIFLGAQAALVLLGFQDAMAADTAAAGAGDGVSIGTGLAIIGIGIPTGLSTIGAALAVGPIGSASLAALTEKPEMFGRTLIYLGLAEGIAIYGLVVSILLLGRI
ncbi:MAG: ATP synthase subunit C [Gammaproteobacteria bacterium]|jgi:V/A-type H+-transporting ATPase subunit K